MQIAQRPDARCLRMTLPFDDVPTKPVKAELPARKVRAS